MGFLFKKVNTTLFKNILGHSKASILNITEYRKRMQP